MRVIQVADAGIKALRESVDSLITIPNDKLAAVLGSNMSLLDAFKSANDVLLHAVQGIAELITRPGLINVDFADVKTVMSEMGAAMMGSGEASGENRAREAAEKAIRSPLLEDINLAGAKGILVNITAGLNLAIGEFDEVGNWIRRTSLEDGVAIELEVREIDRQAFEVDVDLANGLGGIDVKENVAFTAQCSEGLDILDYAGLVIDEHDRGELRVVAQCRRENARVEDAVCTGIQPGNLEALGFESRERIGDGLVLGPHRYKVPAAVRALARAAEDREVVRLGRTRSPDNFPRIGIDQCRDMAACGFHRFVRRPAKGMAA